MSKSKIRTIGIRIETYNKLKEEAEENCQVITSLATKFIENGLNKSESNGGKDSKEKK